MYSIDFSIPLRYRFAAPHDKLMISLAGDLLRMSYTTYVSGWQVADYASKGNMPPAKILQCNLMDLLVLAKE